MLGALVLILVGVATLASTSWFNRQSTFISYFSETVNGLEVGAPVKFQGVPVGRVTELLIQIEPADRTFQVPVRYEVDLSRLTSDAGTFVDLDDPLVLRQQIASGLRAQLQMESIVTGQLYVELAYRTDPSPPDAEGKQTSFPEIPTTPSLLAAFGTQAGSLVGDVLSILFRVNEMLEEVNMVDINQAVVGSANAVERLADSPELRAAFAQVPGLTAQVNETLAAIQQMTTRVEGAIDPLQARLETTNDEVVLALRAVREAMEETRGFLTPDSGVGYRMESAMAALQEAAEALRDLALSLERNPDMLIRGRDPGGR